MKEYTFHSHFFLPFDDWRVEEEVGARAMILDHEMEAFCGVWENR